MKICVIFNPTARGDKARRFRRHLDAIAHQCALKATVAAGHGRTLAAEAVRDGFSTIVAAGGDGTVNEVINGIGDEPRGFERVRLGVLPLGTINVFARELGIPLRLMRAWECILEGAETRVDLPRVEMKIDGQVRTRYFAALGGAGLDSRAISLVDWNAKKKLGPLAYIAAGFKALNMPQPAIAVTNGTRSLKGQLVLFGNGRYYGGSFPLFRKADVCDGKIHACVFPEVSPDVLGKGVAGLLAGRFHDALGAQEISSESMEISSPDQVWVELDGDNLGEVPARLSVAPRALRVVVPASKVRPVALQG